jgi:aliphatic nitrilase
VSKNYPTFKAAACHVAPIFLDSARTIDKAVSLIEEAANNGASLVAFPESFVPGFPIWAALRPPIVNHEFRTTGGYWPANGKPRS